LIDTPNIITADKTKYIEILDRSSQYQFLFLRPPRWGKTTFLAMLADYYDKNKKSKFTRTFSELYIGKNPTSSASALLVLKFNFATISVLATDEVVQKSFDSELNFRLTSFLEDNAEFLDNPDITKLINHASGVESLRRVLVSVYPLWQMYD
jgi:hypothetical protein